MRRTTLPKLLTLSTLLCALCVLAASPAARAVSCTMSPAMPGAERVALEAAAHDLGGDVARGDPAALKSASVAALAGSFDGVAGMIASMAPGLAGATLTVNDLYALDATDLKSTGEDVQFFCSVPGSQLLVTVTLAALPPGSYALALMHATGVAAPQQFALVLQNTGTSSAAHWELAGFFARPLTLAGHDSNWFWTQARALKAKDDPLSSFLYYQAAAYLARPADLFTSNNLEKLSRETAAAEPPGLPGNTPMLVKADGQSFPVTALSCDATLGPLDLRVDSRFADTADPVAARKYAIALMQALVAQHAELRASFHGFWVYETGPNHGSFAVEQSMTALP